MRLGRIFVHLEASLKSSSKLEPRSTLHTKGLMATLTFQRATWCLQLSRTSRLFSVSFTTSLPRNGRLRRLPAELPAPVGSRSTPFHDVERSRTRKSAGDSETRRAYTATRVYRAQQAAQTAPASKTTSLDPQPPSQSTKTSTPDLSEGLNDGNTIIEDGDKQVDWSRSFHGLSTEPFTPEAAKALLAPIPAEDIEVKPDGIIYLPEIKYRRILNQAFGPGGWGLAPRGETIVTAKAVTREYALVALGRSVTSLNPKKSCSWIRLTELFL